MKNTIDREMAEQATGIQENPNGLGQYYTGYSNIDGRVIPGGVEITQEEAYDILRTGKDHIGGVEVPNAGAGSYWEFFTSLGFTEVKGLNDSSSAGDWEFAVKDGDGGDWYIAGQTNRYPRCGFEYWLSLDYGGFSSFEDLCEMMEIIL